MQTKKTLRVGIVVGEHSGDLLGSELVKSLKNENDTDIELFGIGGPKLSELGLKSEFNFKKINVMGLVEPLKNFRELNKLRKNLISLFADKKIDYFISERDTGIYNAINKGIGAATGDIVGLLHAGDVYSDFDVLANVNDAFVRHDTEIVYGHSLVFDKNRNRIVRKNISPVYKESLMKFGWFPSHQSTFFKSSVFSNYGSYNENYKISADYEFLLRLLHVNKIKPVMIDLFIVKFYLGGASSKNIFSVFKSNYECYRAWKKNKLRVPIYTIPLKILRKIMQLRINFFNK